MRPLSGRLVRRVAAALLVGTLSLALVGSGRSQARDSVVVSLQGVTGLDYTTNIVTSILQATRNVLEPLYKYNSQGRLIPALAASLDRPDKVTYVYHLRKGVKFTNGASLTAADVVANLEYQMRADSAESFEFTDVDSIVAKGAHQVVVKLKRPNSTWQRIVGTLMGVMPKSWMQAHPDFGQLGGPGIIGTGPYKLVRSSPDKLTFVRNESYWGKKYWGKKPPIKAATIILNIKDPSAESLAMRAGNIDMAFPPSGSRLYAGASNIKVTTAQGCDTTALALNTRKAPWSDIHVRRAVAHAVNRKEIIQGALDGEGTAITSIIPPVMWHGLLSRAEAQKLQTPAYAFSIKQAKAEMAQSSVPNGFSDTTTVYVGAAEEKVAQILVQQLAPIGIKLTVKSIPLDQWLNDIYYGPRDLKGIFIQAGGCYFTDPSYIASYWVDSANAINNTYNQADFRSRLADNLLHHLVEAQRKAARIKFGTRLLHLLQSQLPYIGLYTSNIQVAVRSPFKLKGFSNNIYTQDFLTQITSS
jgi:peptide/nickel transport system substrate-binding protein